MKAGLRGELDVGHMRSHHRSVVDGHQHERFAVTLVDREITRTTLGRGRGWEWFWAGLAQMPVLAMDVPAVLFRNLWFDVCHGVSECVPAKTAGYRGIPAGSHWNAAQYAVDAIREIGQAERRTWDVQLGSYFYCAEPE